MPRAVKQNFSVEHAFLTFRPHSKSSSPFEAVLYCSNFDNSRLRSRQLSRGEIIRNKILAKLDEIRNNFPDRTQTGQFKGGLK